MDTGERSLRLAFALALLVGCSGATAASPSTSLPVERWARAHRAPSGPFTTAWHDGRAEVATYHGSVSRYGATHDAEAVLIFVTEPLDRRTLVKDDEAREGDRLEVLKLNFALRFQTGIYPYSVLTSVFSPVAAFEGERFSPAKITMTEQDWCGGTFAGIWPDDAAFIERSHSYFASEGDVDARREVPAGALYEDALYIQLRELDGPFAGGEAWRGSVVPSLWHARRDHHPLAALQGEITRRDDADRVVFTLRLEDGYERTFEVARDEAHTLRAFRSSDGDAFELAGSERLAYWELHDPGEESVRAELGLSTGLDIRPAPPTSGAAPE